MNKVFAILPLVAVLAACGSTDPYQKRAQQEREQQEKLAERAIDKAPKWMTDLPKSNSAIYQNGTAVSPDMAMAVAKAKTLAFGKICMSAGGKVDQQSKMFRSDTGGTSAEQSELAIRSFCPGVDITGVEVAESKMISEGGQFRSYVLVALPTGDANRLMRERDQREQRRLSEVRSRESFRDLDAKTRAAQ